MNPCPEGGGGRRAREVRQGDVAGVCEHGLEHGSHPLRNAPDRGGVVERIRRLSGGFAIFPRLIGVARGSRGGRNACTLRGPELVEGIVR